MVARINGDKERALSSRFGVNSYPSFYLVDGTDVYEFENKARSKSNLIAFASGKYKEWFEPIPYLTSPMGPMGQAQVGIQFNSEIRLDLFLVG